jgi:hypothetical protein
MAKMEGQNGQENGTSEQDNNTTTPAQADTAMPVEDLPF